MSEANSVQSYNPEHGNSSNAAFSTYQELVAKVDGAADRSSFYYQQPAESEPAPEASRALDKQNFNALIQNLGK